MLLAIICAYLLYTRPAEVKQETKIATETVSNVKTSIVDTVTTTTDKKPSGEIITKTVKVSTKIADKKTVSEKVTDTVHDSPFKRPGVNNQPCYSLGLNFPILPAPSYTPRNLEVGYRVLGNAWITGSIGLYKNPDITLGIRVDF